MYGLRHDYDAAKRCFEKAVSFSPRKTETLDMAGRLSVDFARQQMAEQYFQRASEQKDATPETFVRLAGLYERLRRTEEAGVMVNRALQLDGNCASARLTRARLNRQAGRLDEAERVLRPILVSAGRDIRIQCCYELGAILDRQGRYDEAMTAFLEAKTLLSPEVPPLLAQRQAVSAYWKDMQANLSGEALKRWVDFNPAFQPPSRLAFLGGYPRSGTTLLEQVLDSHADIVSAEETPVFHDNALAPLRRNLPPNANLVSVLESAQSDALLQSRRNYYRTMELHLGNPVGTRLLIDKNPSNNFLIPAFIRVFPEIKFLIALRDPRDVCLSCFMQAHLPLTKGSVAYVNLENTVEAYSETMGFWRTLAPLIKNPCLEVRYEDMVEDLESVARKTLDFLGVPWDARVLGFDEHARKKPVRSPTYADVTQPVYKRAVNRWRNYQKYLEPHLEKLAPFVKAFGYE
jgi:tetratricopeptide (TPR) repeat protein